MKRGSKSWSWIHIKMKTKLQLEHLPEAVQCQIPQTVDVKAMGSRLQPINGPIDQTTPFRQLQEAHHPLDLSQTGHHGNCWTQVCHKKNTALLKQCVCCLWLWPCSHVFTPRSIQVVSDDTAVYLWNINALKMRLGSLPVIRLCCSDRNWFYLRETGSWRGTHTATELCLTWARTKT